MVETQQHQEPINHAIEAAEAAILIAQKAEHHAQEALTEADPQLIQIAQSALVQAKRQVADATKQLKTYDNDSYGQQIKQTLQQLQQSSQDLEINQGKVDMPKQVR
jgi:Mg/Co/Ni transporter MgtE